MKGIQMIEKEKSLSENQDIRASEYREEVVAGFENLWVWQKAHQLMLEVHEICRTLPRHQQFKKRYQLVKSSSSVPDHVAQGHTSDYYRDKIKGFHVARKEAGETQNHIIALQGKRYIQYKSARNIVKRYEEIIHGINGYIRWVREHGKGKT
jgi:four helix bundle protein